MINFFRKIRKKFADDNKPLKYLWYALGEILLVVIGILLALQINNWNQEVKNKNKELGYLRGLKEEFEANLEETRINLTYNKKYLSFSEML